MVCGSCKRKFDSNDDAVLLTLPHFAAENYPVETKYALPNRKSHLERTATEVFDSLILTYGNGELCSRLLYNAINRQYVQSLKKYYSYLHYHRRSPYDVFQPFLLKDGEYIRQFPPLGDTIRDMYDEAASSSMNAWGISDHDRNAREIQSLECKGGIFAQDHTFSTVKNCYDALGAKAVWDVATGSGEIACAILVPTTQGRHFSHAARALFARESFAPKVMCSDTWPHLSDFWSVMSEGTIEGRLGLFHHQKRIVSTLKKKHIDHLDAVAGLLSALCCYEPNDCDRLLQKLKDGSLSSKGKQYTASEIQDMKSTRTFRERYAKYLRKQLRPPEVIRQNLDVWFNRWKVTASSPDRPALGRLDPIHQCPLFTSETREAVENCKLKAEFVPDTLPLEQMHDVILPNPNSKHQLTECLSLRGESKLEAFHDRAGNFANTGMRNSLADNLNLMGTARFNLAIRHKRSLAIKNTPEIENPTNEQVIVENPTKEQAVAALMEARKRIPAGWEKVLPYFNHSELQCVNRLAQKILLPPPFPNAEPVPQEDNGERFFSKYVTVVRPLTNRYDENEMCICQTCLTRNKDKHASFPIVRDKDDVVEPTPTKTFDIANVAAVDTDRHQAGPPHQRCTQITSNRNNSIITNTTMYQPVQFMAGAMSHFQLPWGAQLFCPMPPTTNCFYPPAPCCHKCSVWLTKRVGRPPHDDHCQVRMNKPSKHKPKQIGR